MYAQGLTNGMDLVVQMRAVQELQHLLPYDFDAVLKLGAGHFSTNKGVNVLMDFHKTFCDMRPMEELTYSNILNFSREWVNLMLQRCGVGFADELKCLGISYKTYDQVLMEATYILHKVDTEVGLQIFSEMPLHFIHQVLTDELSNMHLHAVVNPVHMVHRLTGKKDTRVCQHEQDGTIASSGRNPSSTPGDSLPPSAMLSHRQYKRKNSKNKRDIHAGDTARVLW